MTKKTNNRSRNRRSSGSRNRKKFRSKGLLWAFVVLGLTIVGIVAMFFLREPVVKRNLAIIRDANWVVNSDRDSFDGYIADRDVGQLLLDLENLQDEAHLKFLIRLNYVEKRIAIADRIISLNPKLESKDSAKKIKLEALMLSLVIALENNLDVGHSPAELSIFSESLAGESNQELEKLASVATALGYIGRYLNANSPESRNEQKQRAITRFDKLSRSAPNDPVIAEKLFGFLEAMLANAKFDAYQEFFDVLENAYAKSENPKIFELLTADRSPLSNNRRNQFVEIINVPFSERPAAVTQLAKQLEQEWTKADLSSATVSAAFQRMRDLLVIGRIDEVKTFRKMVDEATENSMSDLLQNNLAGLDKKIELFDRSFDIAPLRDLNNRPVSFQEEAPRFRILFILTEQTFSAAVLKFDELLHSLRNQIKQSEVEIAAIYLFRKKEGVPYNDFKKFAAKSEHWRVWFLDTSTEYGQNFMNKILPVRQFPYILMLGGDDQKVKFAGVSITKINEVFAAD